MSKTKFWSYDLIKSKICAKRISRNELENCKNLFKNEIQSTRRSACIQTIEDLLDCLERREGLAEYNIEPLRIIAENFADDEIEIALEEYVAPPESPCDSQNAYALQRTQESSNKKADIRRDKRKMEQKPIVIIEFTQEKRDNIYALIAREIGRDWRFLGRELLLRAGDLDKIDIKHPNDLHSKVYEVFEIFENDSRHNPRDHYNIICEALDNCKRKDIRRFVQKIMSY